MYLKSKNFNIQKIHKMFLRAITEIKRPLTLRILYIWDVERTTFQQPTLKILKKPKQSLIIYNNILCKIMKVTVLCIICGGRWLVLLTSEVLYTPKHLSAMT